MNSALMFSKASDEWSTPQDFYDALDAEFSFGIDAAATRDNRKCRGGYYGLDDGGTFTHPYFGDALASPWGLHAAHWLNPPYSQCRAFIAKAAEERRNGVLTVALVPARTDTRWFHDHLWDADTHQCRPGIELRFIRGRLKFGEAENGAPFPSMVVVFRPGAR